MSNYDNDLKFKQLDSEDTDYVCGGVSICENINSKYSKVSPSQRCNCGQFSCAKKCGHIDICDNCSWARSPYLGSDVVYCSKQVSSN